MNYKNALQTDFLLNTNSIFERTGIQFKHSIFKFFSADNRKQEYKKKVKFRENSNLLKITNTVSLFENNEN